MVGDSSETFEMPPGDQRSSQGAVATGIHCNRCGFLNDATRGACKMCLGFLLDAAGGQTCPSCATDNPRKASFCKACGRALDAGAVAAPSTFDLVTRIIEQVGDIGHGGAAGDEEYVDEGIYADDDEDDYDVAAVGAIDDAVGLPEIEELPAEGAKPMLEEIPLEDIPGDIMEIPEPEPEALDLDVDAADFAPPPPPGLVEAPLDEADDDFAPPPPPGIVEPAAEDFAPPPPPPPGPAADDFAPPPPPPAFDEAEDDFAPPPAPPGIVEPAAEEAPAEEDGEFGDWSLDFAEEDEAPEE